MYVRVNRTGSASLSRKAVEAIGNPDYVVVLVDRERGLFGIRRAEPHDLGARAARKVGTGYTRTIRFSDLLRIAGATKRMGAVSVKLEDGILVGSLSDLAKLPLAGEPRPRKRKEKEGEFVAVPGQRGTSSPSKGAFGSEREEMPF
ncbi:hypothetical protein [Brockia lithotrophica]|uniref:Uncharacterized protein n=1 Tax=Brockia lithotrophica TaxID=933949 RepID=A0A660KTA4_9BACL|nr:hypothetical protein [Brockia lithotrophica]RKQ83696.1 hypothetical protein C7438_1727 [Brockia lithotrophica]